MIISLCSAFARTADNGIKYNTPYYLFIRSAQSGEISIHTHPECNSEIIYGNIHDFLKDWQDIVCYGYANNEEDLLKLFTEIKTDKSLS